MKILYEDQDLVCIDKPPGIVVNTADSVQSSTVQEWFAAYNSDVCTPSWKELVPSSFDARYGQPEDIFAQRQGVVHRLDKDTSGVLLLARNPGSLVHLLDQFKRRLVQKTYTCCVHGKVDPEQGSVAAPLGRSVKDRKTFTVTADGRAAHTQYSLSQFYPHFNTLKWKELFDKKKLPNVAHQYTGNHKSYFKTYQGFSVVVCRPLSGRTHQIRVHMKHIGHPLVADSTYVGRKRAKADALWCARQFLHASELTFTHPRTGKKIVVTSELPTDLQLALLCLGKSLPRSS